MTERVGYKKLAVRLMPLYITSLAVLVVDRVTKDLVVGQLGTDVGSYRPVVDDVLWFRLVHNSGAAFGLLPSASILFAVAAVAVTIGIIFYSRKLAAAPSAARVALGLVLGGAIGNLIDRLTYGYVVDFVDFRMWPRVWQYVFNIADASITIGVLLLLVYYLFGGAGGDERAKRARTANDRAAHGD